MTEARRWLLTAWTTATTELRRWLRSRAAVASAVVLPVGMTALMTVAIADADFHAAFAVVDEDGGPVAAAFVDDALGSPAVKEVVDVRRVATESAARRMLDSDDVAAAIVLPAELSESLAVAEEGGTAPVGRIDVLRSDDHPIAGDLAVLVVKQFETRLRATSIAVANDVAPPTGPAPLELTVTAPGGSPLEGATEWGPPVGVFFLLATLGFGAQRLVTDRQRGLVERLAAAPVAPSAVLAGRAGATVLVGGLSLGMVALSSQLVFGQSWGPSRALLVVVVAVVVAMGGIAALVALLARTPGQAQALSVGLGFAFVLASGSFGPATRPSFAELVPTTHAIDAFALLATENAQLATVAPSIAALLGFGAGAALLAWIVSRSIGWRLG